MGSNSMLAFASALFSSALALAVMLRRRHSVASWCFSFGMLLFAAENVLSGISVEAPLSKDIAFWEELVLLIKALLPAVWLCFSLSYSRGNYREFLVKSRFLLIATFLLPVAIAIGFRGELLQVSSYTEQGQHWWVSFSGSAKVLNGFLLVSTVLILMNLERTFRSAVGTMQWRIKFLVLGLGIIFGVRIYTRSQALLFSGYNLELAGIETSALLIGCMLITIGYLRAGFTEVDVYPSRAVLHTSVTVLLAGGYLFVVGILAQIIPRVGGSRTFQIQAFLILLGIALLVVLLLSDRLRQKLQRFVSRHFKRPQHDFRKIWTSFTQCTSNLLDRGALCTTLAKLIARTFNVLSVSIWLFDEENHRLVFASSTSQQRYEKGDPVRTLSMNERGLTGLRSSLLPFDLEKEKADWAEDLRQSSPSQFRTGGNRLCIPLQAGERLLGAAILADRVAGVPYTTEELDLLKCIGDQIAASLLNLNLNEEIMRAKELEAFQTISAFFVHDLKNAASTLSLMLQNLPVYFDDPVFRKDALRGIGETVKRINQLIERVSALGPKLELKLGEFDLNLLVNEALEAFNGEAGVKWVTELRPLPKLVADREQLRSVVTNLLLNAREAIDGSGRVAIETKQEGDWATLSVADNGSGMDPLFMRDSLFRPFHTTKKKGLGIGMFQSKIIIEAHRGSIQVNSEPGKGTTFRIKLPLRSSVP